YRIQPYSSFPISMIFRFGLMMILLIIKPTIPPASPVISGSISPGAHITPTKERITQSVLAMRTPRWLTRSAHLFTHFPSSFFPRHLPFHEMLYTYSFTFQLVCVTYDATCGS